MQKIPNEPVSEVKIVTQREKCPPGYYLLEKTVTGQDAQLFDNTWRHKGKRYLCYSKQPGSHVIVDMSIINDGDPVTRGYTALTNAYDDTTEKAFRKHQLCIRVLPKDQATQAICDMTLVNKSKGETPPPGYYTITNDVNDLHICFRMAPLIRYQPPATVGPATYSYSSAPHSVGPNRQQWFGQPQAPGQQPMPTPWQQQNMQQPYMPHHAMPAAKMSAQTGIEGLPFEIGSKFDVLWKKSGHNVAGIPKMSSQDIISKFDYDFTQERRVIPG